MTNGFVVFVVIAGAETDARVAVFHEASSRAATRHAAVAFSDPVVVGGGGGSGSGSGDRSHRMPYDGIWTSWSSSSCSSNVVLGLLVRGGSFPLTLSSWPAPFP